MTDFMIYGATGYTGQLIAETAVQRGLKPILAGRSQEKLSELAEQLGLQYRVFRLEDPQAIRKGLAGCALVLNCAGPFKFTSRPVADACLELGIHYLDITGEIDVFEALAARDQEAKDAGVMLLPGAGFDVVPTDCLGAYLKRQLPDANELDILIYGMGGQSTHGTMLSMVESLSRPNRIRKDGQVVDVPYGAHLRTINLPIGKKRAMGIPWGDVSTAYYTTGIPNIVVYSASMVRLRGLLRLLRPFQPLLGASLVKQMLRFWIKRKPSGPTPLQREHSRSIVWGEVRAPSGESRRALLECPEGYQLTAQTAVLMVEKVLAGAVFPGFQTPAKAYGANLILEIPDVLRENLS